MRQYVKAPVHAYLISGPVGSSLHDAVLTFAAGLAVSPERVRHLRDVSLGAERR